MYFHIITANGHTQKKPCLVKDDQKDIIIVDDILIQNTYICMYLQCIKWAVPYVIF